MESHIPDELYKTIIQNLPIVCVDVIVRRGSHVLLVRRANEPLRGAWWIPGGRVMLFENTKDAAQRKVFLETGLTLHEAQFVGFYEEIYDTSAFKVPCHTISIVYEGDGLGDVKPNEEVLEWAWDKYLPERFVSRFYGNRKRPAVSKEKF